MDDVPTGHNDTHKLASANSTKSKPSKNLTSYQ